MRSYALGSIWMGILAFLLSGPALHGEEIQVVVASNFAETLRAVAAQFEKETGHRVLLISGATGKHYAQIKNGAPFDLFFAADAERPERLEREGVAVPGSRFTYALGKLVLWSPRKGLVDSTGSVLRRGDFRHVALANPKLAPYGRAAQEVLQALGLWDALQGKMVRGENIGQTYQFIQSGNAELGFVALAQVMRPGRDGKGAWWELPRELYQPIVQQAVLLKESETARAFLAFVKSDTARKIIQSYGYDTP